MLTVREDWADNTMSCCRAQRTTASWCLNHSHMTRHHVCIYRHLCEIHSDFWNSDEYLCPIWKTLPQDVFQTDELTTWEMLISAWNFFNMFVSVAFRSCEWRYRTRVYVIRSIYITSKPIIIRLLVFVNSLDLCFDPSSHTTYNDGGSGLWTSGTRHSLWVEAPTAGAFGGNDFGLYSDCWLSVQGYPPLSPSPAAFQFSHLIGFCTDYNMKASGTLGPVDSDSEPEPSLSPLN